MSTLERWLSAAVVTVLISGGLLLYGRSLLIDAEKRGFDRAVAQQHERENEALEKALADRDRLAKELEGVTRDAREKTVALGDAQLAAADVGRRLQLALAALRRGAQCPATAAPGGTPAQAAERVLADVQQRLDAAAERIARFADQSHIAGVACERSYDALK